MDRRQTGGRILTRRDALKLLGLGSAAFLAACATPEGTKYVGANECIHFRFVPNQHSAWIVLSARTDAWTLFCG